MGLSRRPVHAPARWPIPLEPTELRGSAVHLTLLTRRDAPELSRIGADPVIWRFLTARADTPGRMHQYVDGLVSDWSAGDALPFVIRRNADRAAIGITRLKHLSRAHRTAIVGSWLIVSAWGTGANTEAKYLLLAHAFDDLGMIRLEFHTDVENTRSRRALANLGAREEGVLRCHQLRRDGSRRDTVMFSIIDTDWPDVRVTLLARIARHTT